MWLITIAALNLAIRAFNGEAIADFAEAIRLNPKSSDAFNYRGAMHGNKGERAKKRLC